jgi:hypothetical protein
MKTSTDTIQKKYLHDPFDRSVEQSKSMKIRDEFRIIQAPTGLGKTHAMRSHFIPKLFENDVILQICLVPEWSVRDDERLHAAVSNYGASFVADDLDKVKSLYEHGARRIVLVMTNHRFTNKSGRDFQDWMIQNLPEDTFAIHMDEAQKWTVTKKNYRDTIGSSNSSYKEAMLPLISNLAKYTSYIYGITATPHKEMMGKLETGVNLRYNILNTYPPKQELVSVQAWLNNYKFFKPEDSEQMFEQFIHDFVTAYKKDKLIKRVAIIKCSKDNGKDGNMNLDMVMQILKEKAKQYPDIIDENHESIAVLTDRNNYFMTLNGKKRKVKRDSGVIQSLRKNTHPGKFLVVIDKGSIGLDIKNGGEFISFRESNLEDISHEPLPNSARQQIGRVIRSPLEDPSTEGTDITNLFLDVLRNKELSDVEKNEKIEDLIYSNSYNLYLVDTESNRKAVEQTKLECNTVTDARKWVSRLKKDVEKGLL